MLRSDGERGKQAGRASKRGGTKGKRQALRDVSNASIKPTVAKTRKKAKAATTKVSGCTEYSKQAVWKTRLRSASGIRTRAATRASAAPPEPAKKAKVKTGGHAKRRKPSFLSEGHAKRRRSLTIHSDLPSPPSTQNDLSKGKRLKKDMRFAVGSDPTSSDGDPEECECNYNLPQECFDPKRFTKGIAPVDRQNVDSVNQVTDYTTDIFRRLFHAERKGEEYMSGQRQINVMMRSILVDWLVEVHMKFRLVPETLYLSVNILDRYLTLVQVERRKLQLVGVTSLLLACKYEEIYPPEVRDCVYITDRAYTRQDVIDMEQHIIQTLGFRLTVATAYPFLLRFFLITEATRHVKLGATYYLERTLQDYVFLDFRPSMVAAGALVLALNHRELRAADEVEGVRPGIPKVLMDYTGYTFDDILDAAITIENKIRQEIIPVSQRQLIAVKRKYQGRKYAYVSSYARPTAFDVEDGAEELDKDMWKWGYGKYGLRQRSDVS